MAGAIAVLVFLFAIPAAYATNHVVGDSNGWNTGVNYDDWARGKTFNVGDSLLFNYDGSHSVDKVTSSDYSSCSATNPITTATSSPTNITLTSSGPHYFICQTFGHCGQGMKLQVTAADATGSTPATPNTPATPSTPRSGSPPADRTPSGTPTPARTNDNNDGFRQVTNLVLAVPLMLGTLVALMG